MIFVRSRTKRTFQRMADMIPVLTAYWLLEQYRQYVRNYYMADFQSLFKARLLLIAIQLIINPSVSTNNYFYWNFYSAKVRAPDANYVFGLMLVAWLRQQKHVLIVYSVIIEHTRDWLYEHKRRITFETIVTLNKELEKDCLCSGRWTKGP
jgi:hypothetical protein